jgi:outer membrane protein assembly factor BamB
MTHHTSLRIVLSLAALAAAGSLKLSANDWPRWRGPLGTGISAETGWRVQWPTEGPKVLWKAGLGVGWSSMSVSQGRVFTMGNTEDVDTVFCFDAATGKSVWKHTYPCTAKDPNGYPGPRCTPTVDGKRVYTLSRNGHFFCLDFDSGKVVWSKDFAKDYGAKPPTWGYAGSPLIEGDWVITEVGGAGSSLVAFNKTDGKEIWKAGDDGVAYSSIVAFDAKGQRCLAVFCAPAIVGRSAKDGQELWRYPWKTSYDVNAATPIVQDGKVFVSSGYGKGCVLLDIAGGAAKPVWEHKKMRNHVGSCILRDGHLYGFDENQLKCLEWATGNEKWAERTYGKGALTLAGDRFILFSDRGRVATAELTPAGCKEIAGFQVLEGKDTWAVPVLANGLLYCRAGNDLACLDVKGK